MDRAELNAALQRAGVPGYTYELQGVHEPAGYLTEFYFLRRQAGKWVVGIYERSQYKEMMQFAEEDEACRYLYARLTDKGPEPTPLTSEEARHILRDSEEIQRVAWENFQRARRGETTGPPQSENGGG
jgi:hypothetical protein